MLVECPDGSGSELLLQRVKCMPGETVSCKPSTVVNYTDCFVYLCDLTDINRMYNILKSQFALFVASGNMTKNTNSCTSEISV